MVTRTFTITKARVYYANVEQGIIDSVDTEYCGNYTPEQIIRFERKKGHENAIKAEIISHDTQLRGMSSEDFLSYSEPITRKEGVN